MCINLMRIKNLCKQNASFEFMPLEIDHFDWGRTSQPTNYTNLNENCFLFHHHQFLLNTKYSRQFDLVVFNRNRNMPVAQ